MTLVCLEFGKRRVFASALQWPGWCRSGRSEHDALEALATYADRYAEVVDVAGLSRPDPAADFVVVERLTGDMTTDFGAPAAIATWEREPLAGAEAQRLAGLLRSSWTVLDGVVDVTPAELRKGPRGGGRDRDAMVDHILGAEVAYGRKVGVRQRQRAHDDPGGIAALREDLVGAVLAGDTQPAPAWPPRYAVRRIAWHALDHAWEMQDRTHPA